MYIPANREAEDAAHIARDASIPTPPPVPEWWSSSSTGSSSATHTSLSSISTVSSTGSAATGAIASNAKSGLSPAVIGAIVAGVVVFVAVIALFFVRRWYIMRRQTRTDKSRTWVGYDTGLDSITEKAINPTYGISDESESVSVLSKSTVSHSSDHGSNASTDGTVGSVIMPSRQTPAPDQSHLRPLALVAKVTGFNNPQQVDTRSASPTPSLAVVPPPSENAHPTSNAPDPHVSYIPAIMQRPFIRSLPDELPTSVGEQVGIVREYDDGWTFCVTLNEVGAPIEQGMVPSECLEKLPANSVTQKPSVSGVDGQTKIIREG